MSRPRRTQAQRTAETRLALLEAAYDALVERGYRATTTTEVAHRAGVSMGALLHHFPTKTDLVVAAAAHVFDRRREEYRAAMESLDPSADKLGESLRLLWSMMSSPGFTGVLELVVAARTDPALAEAFAEVNTEFIAVCERYYADLWRGDDGTPDPAFPPAGFHLAWSVMEGLALSRQIPGHAWHPVEDVLDVLKALIDLAILSSRQDPPKE